MTILRFIVVVLSASWASALAGHSYTKPNVYIDYFSRPADMSFNEAEQLRNSIMQALKETCRVDIIDVDTKQAIAIERERRENGVVSDENPERLKVMVEEGADYLIQGSITSFAEEQTSRKNGKEYFNVIINYNLKLIDPNNGKVVNSSSFKVGAGDDAFGQMLQLIVKTRSREVAMMDACREAVFDVERFIDEALPLEGKLLDTGTVKSGKVEDMYINLGSNAGIKKGDRFMVCVRRNIGGEIARSEVGRVDVHAVEGGNVSLAKVKKGKKEIFNAISAGQEVIVLSIPKEISPAEKIRRMTDVKLVGGRPLF